MAPTRLCLNQRCFRSAPLPAVAFEPVSVADPTHVALVEMRKARQKARVSQIHWVDALYHVYLAAMFGAIGVAVLAGVVGGDPLDAEGLGQVARHGAAVLGLIPALALAIGLRSGSRGGPLALEAPDVRHVLMSPVDRAFALRGPALRQLRFGLFMGTVVGGVAGMFAQHRLGHNAVALMACGALYGASTVMLGLGGALAASGRRLPRWLTTLIGFVLVAWSVADVVGKGPTAPGSFLGKVPLWPLDFDVWGVAPVAVALVLVAVGLAGIAGISIEHAERRTKLVGQLRFAVTLQDLRTVLVLRRQLSQEMPREQPWIGGKRRRAGRATVWSRGWWGVMRWPASRLVRLVILAVIAGFAARGVWNGVYPLAVLVGLAMWVAGLDAMEPLAQETDHPSRRDSYPCDVGELMVRHLAVSAVVMFFVALLAMAVFVLAGPSSDALQVAAISLVPLGFAGLAGAVVSVLMGAPSPGAPSDVSALLPPEFAGMKNALRAAWPPGLAVLGAGPVAAASALAAQGTPWQRATIACAIAVVGAGLCTAAWVRYREDIHEWWRLSKEEAMAQQAERAKARERRTDEED